MKSIVITVLVALLFSATCMAADLWGNEDKVREIREVLGYNGGLTAEEWNSRGVTLAHGGEIVEALECFNRAIRLDLDYAWAWNNKGVALHLFILNPRDYAYIGAPAYLTAIDASNVLLAYDEALRLDPELAEAWYNKGQLYYSMGEYWSAIQCYDHAIDIYPEWGAAWKNKANVYIEMDYYPIAWECIRMAEELDPLVKESAKMLYLLS